MNKIRKIYFAIWQFCDKISVTGVRAMMKWSVRFSLKAGNQYEKLKKSGKRPPINDTIDFLVLELINRGPERTDWPNYSKLSKKTFHCHLKKGKPTYVACWAILDEELKYIEIYYVGTHENAPY